MLLFKKIEMSFSTLDDFNEKFSQLFEKKNKFALRIKIEKIFPKFLSQPDLLIHLIMLSVLVSFLRKNDFLIKLFQ